MVESACGEHGFSTRPPDPSGITFTTDDAIALQGPGYGFTVCDAWHTPERQLVDVLRSIYVHMHYEKALRAVFWQHVTIPTPQMFSDILVRQLLFPAYVDDARMRHMAGLAWISEVQPQQCTVNVWYKRRYWGAQALQLSRLWFRWFFGRPRVLQVWGLTPWHTAVRHLERLGGSVYCVLPGYTYLPEKDEYQSAYLMRLTHTQFWAQEQSYD